jgi:aldose sugar dehydrogenase
MRWFYVSAAGLLVFTLALLDAAHADVASEQSLHLEALADKLDSPWGLALLPDGRMLVTERSGAMLLLDAQGRRLAQINNVPEAFVKLQGGLLDVALHPQFARNSTIYLSLAHGRQKHNTTRVVRAVLSGDTLTDVEVIFDNTPKGTSVHYGGRLAFMSDGTLLVTTGEGADYRERAQRLDVVLGKIVRINDDGTIPHDNPFVDTPGADPAIWSYGHRNPQGLYVDVATGTVYSTEHGPKGGDEINVIEKGVNYGWPVATHGIDYSGARISPFETYDGMREPLLYWTPSIGPGGVALYRGPMFPEWEGDLLVAVLGYKQLRRVDIENGRVVAQEPLLEDLKGRFRQVEIGADGAIYAVVESIGEAPQSGQILKITRRTDRPSASDPSQQSTQVSALRSAPAAKSP